MKKITKKDFRTLFDVTLPASNITLKLYSSLLVGDVISLGITGESLEDGMKTLTKLIVEWNYFASETDEKPLEITSENINTLPVSDIVFMSEKIKELSSAEKKS